VPTEYSPAAASDPARILRVVESKPGRLSDPARAVREENIAAAHASGLDPNDPHWRLAMETSRRLDGATLAPERRLQLLGIARRLGVRPFDANVVIAMTQDRARRGEGLDGLDRLIRTAAPSSSDTLQRSTGTRLLVAASAAAMIVGGIVGAVLIRWIEG
jgi:hypothetical protein